MPLTPEPETTRSDSAGTVLRDSVAYVIVETTLEEPGLGLVLGGITLVVLLVWTVIKGIFELFGGPSQSLFG